MFSLLIACFTFTTQFVVMCFTCAFTLTQDQCCVYLRWRDSVWFVVVCNVYGTPICLSGGTRARIPFLSFLPFFFGLGLQLLCFASHSIPPASAHSTRNLNWVLGEEITSRAADLEAALEAAPFPLLVHQPQVALIVSFPSSFILKSMSLLFLFPSSRLLWFPIRGLEEG